MTRKKLQKWQYLFSVIFLIILLGLIFWGANCVFNKKSVTSEPKTSSSVAGEKIIKLKGENGKTVLEVLKSQHNVQSQQYDFGVMVVGIDGIKNSDEEFWLFYVNGEISPVGADQFVTKDSDQIEWRLQKSENG